MGQALRDHENDTELQAERRLLMHIVEEVSSTRMISFHEAMENCRDLQTQKMIIDFFDQDKRFMQIKVNEQEAMEYKNTLEGVLSNHKELLPYYFNARTEELERFFRLTGEYVERLYEICVQTGVLSLDRWDFVKQRIMMILEDSTKVEHASISDVLRKTPERHVGKILERAEQSKMLTVSTDKLKLDKHSGELKRLVEMFDQSTLLQYIQNEDPISYLRLVAAGRSAGLWSLGTPLFDT